MPAHLFVFHSPRTFLLLTDRARTHFSAEYAGQPSLTQEKLESGKECSSGKEENLNTQRSVDACRAACIAKKGASCRFFIFGTGSKAGYCYWEESCDSFSTNKYDAYTVVTPKRKCTYYTPKVDNVSLSDALAWHHVTYRCPTHLRGMCFAALSLSTRAWQKLKNIALIRWFCFCFCFAGQNRWDPAQKVTPTRKRARLVSHLAPPASRHRRRRMITRARKGARNHHRPF